ncbi:hypothetical protein [Deinococcus sp. QL22]|uniref:hypothetical protein n=1 Tax=Deinococcus sp. QL22 TaxID=2939437 RepID=UPI002017CB7F|nr:hypothetical protein [Deinococcus sp. QL22]UQN09304.1 hypothetical protein M1R55_22290 [Deinococcus sp. QL22]
MFQRLVLARVSAGGGAAHVPKENIATYHPTHPPDLATSDGLKQEGLHPAENQRVAALFRLRTGNRELLTGLFRRSDAVPVQVKAQLA